MVDKILTYLPLLLAIGGFLYIYKKRLKKYYKVVLKRTEKLRPKQILGNRPYDDFYYPRNEDEEIKKSLLQKKNLLVIGRPLSGKTRAVYQVLKKELKNKLLLFPKIKGIESKDFLIPNSLFSCERRIILLDDLHRLVEQDNFEELLNEADEKKILIIATCRSGGEYEKVVKELDEKRIDVDKIFKAKVEIKKISKTEAKEISEDVSRDWGKVRLKFDGTVGSIFMPLTEMETRFADCSDEERAIMRAIRRLYFCGIYEEDRIFKLNHIKALAEIEELRIEKYKWPGMLKQLDLKNLIKQENDMIRAEEAYLEYIVKENLKDIELYEQVLLAFSDDPESLFKLGVKVYFDSFLKPEKEKIWNIVLKIFGNVIEIKPDSHQALVYKGRVFLSLEKSEEAFEAFNKAIEIKPDFCLAWQLKGHTLIALNKNKEAFKAFDKAVKFSKDYPQKWVDIGRDLSLHQKKYKEAILAFDKALELKPDSQEAIHQKGLALVELGRYKEVIEFYDKVLALKPDHHASWFWKGFALGKLKKYKEAISFYDKLIAIEPDTHYNWFHKGVALFGLKKDEEAIKAIDKSIELNLNIPEALLHTGVTLIKFEKHEESIKAFNKAIELKPDYAEAYYNKGLALLNLGKYEAAIDSYDKAIKIKPDYHQAWYNKGLALEKLGRDKEAEQAFAKAKQFEQKP